LGVRETLDTERFDLVLLNWAFLVLRFEVISQGRLIYAQDEETIIRFEMDVIHKTKTQLI